MKQDTGKLHERIDQRISEERRYLESRNTEAVVTLIEQGMAQRAANHLFLFADEKQWKEITSIIAARIEAAADADADTTAETTTDAVPRRRNLFDFIAVMKIGLFSVLPEWRMVKKFSAESLSSFRESYTKFAAAIPLDHPAAKELLENYAEEAEKRFRTEARDEKEIKKTVDAILNGSIEAYTDMIIKELQQSALYKHSQEVLIKAESIEEALEHMWGNDYGAFLQFAMWEGAVFQTTNPPLIKMAYDLDSEGWAERCRKLVEEIDMSDLPMKGLSRSEIDTAIIPTAIVEANCCTIRDFYVFLEGNAGFVCYQVNPRNHGSAEKMEAEARFVFSLMEKRLGGFEPNVSFKLPGTRAGLEAAEKLSRDGYSITITLSFGLFQAVEFAKVLSQGTAKVSSVVIMNGRLAFPVRDQLMQEHPDDAEAFEEAAKWVGVETTRHLHEKLYASPADGGLGIDPKRVRIMNASLRIYGLDIPDVMEIWGSPSITIFPNVRHALDKKERLFSKKAVFKKTHQDVMEKLCQGEMFRQAWWTPGDDDSCKPTQPLSLAETNPESISSWVPISVTLNQFLDAYGELEKRAAAAGLPEA